MLNLARINFRFVVSVLLLSAGLLMMSLTAHSQAPRATVVAPLPSPEWSTRLIVRDAKIPIELARLRIDSKIVGRIAQTRYEFEFYNPNQQILEAELQFALAPNQTVTGFALDIDGSLRPAVAVEKAKGQQIFEDIVRTRVDPALLEKTVGNNFKLRVYPLPTQGSRRVVIDVSEFLVTNSSVGKASNSPSLLYQIPLQFAQAIKSLEVNVDVAGFEPASITARLGATVITANKTASGETQVALKQSNYSSNGIVQIRLPSSAKKPFLSVSEYKGKSYFYAEVPIASKTAFRETPKIISLVWDASGSAASRNQSREFALLEQFFRTYPTLEVDLIIVRDAAQPTQRFSVKNSQWSDLQKVLEQTIYDGASNLGAVTVAENTDLTLLFSDGISNFGENYFSPGKAPLIALNSANSVETNRLREIAENSGGVFIDLMRFSTAEAMARLRTNQTRLGSLRATGATELFSASRFIDGATLAIAGQLTEPKADIELELIAPDGTRTTRRIDVQTKAEAKLKSSSQTQPTSAANTINLAAMRWANLKLESLEIEPEKNQAAIKRLGSQFALLTSNTSLIVLDSVQDYVRYDIEPPIALQAAWQRLTAQKRERELDDKTKHLERIVSRFNQRQNWWNRDFPKETPPAPKSQEKAASGAGVSSPSAAPRVGMASPPPAPAPAPAASAPSVAPSAAPPHSSRAATENSPATASASITLKKWVPDAPYVKRLREAKPEERYARYLDERPSYLSSTAFFLDAADIFFEQQQPDLALRILSNLAEMNLENRHILRILGYRLNQAKKSDLALPIFAKVLRLSPNEPQSYRDLGLAYEQNGQPQKAVDLLWEVVTKPWNNRFPDIEMICLAELNAIVAANQITGKTALVTSSFDPRLLKNLPLDLRVVLSWDADNTDIDLWVTDPNGERAFYGKRLTYQGGAMSADFVGGYGPEEFAIKFAKPGKYTVTAMFYGHNQQLVAPATTLMLKFSTGFGSAKQVDQDIILRLSGRRQEVVVGTFDVK